LLCIRYGLFLTSQQRGRVRQRPDSSRGVLLKDGEDVLEKIELECQCGSHLLVLAQKSSRLMMSDSFEVPSASLTMVTLLFLPTVIKGVRVMIGGQSLL